MRPGCQLGGATACLGRCTVKVVPPSALEVTSAVPPPRGGTPSSRVRHGAPGWLSQGLMEETIEASGEALLRFGVEWPRTLGLDACLAQAGHEISDRQPLRDGRF